MAGCKDLPEEVREGEGREGLVKEVMGYFCESWGNRTRIDYGSGHELNFICWMYVPSPPSNKKIKNKK